MKRWTIASPLMALGLTLSSVFASIPLGTSSALADDYDNGNRPAWSYRCDRNWNPLYCLPDRGNTRDQDWRGNRDWRSQDWGRIQAWCDRQGWRNNDWPNSDWRRSQEWCERQEWRNSRNGNYYGSRRLSSGTYIPTSIERRRQIVLDRWNDRASLTLVVRQDIVDNRGRTVIRRDSRIQGELVPYNGGYRFEADRIILPNGNTEDISAVSRVIGRNDYSYDRDRRNERASNAAVVILGSVLRGASSDSGSFGNVFSDAIRRSDEQPGVFGGVYDPRYPQDSRYPQESRYPQARRGIVIYPDQDLDLKLTREFSLN